MMIESLAQEQAKKFFGRVWEDAFGYLRLYEFLKLRAGPVLSRSPRHATSVAEFWYGVLNDRFVDPRVTKYTQLRDGDIVRFRGGFLCDWAPKLPGQLWTTAGAVDLERGLTSVKRTRRYGDSMYAILDPYGKRKVLDAGRGSVRLATARKDADSYAYMALVDDDRWNCDYGVPLVVSRSVFASYKSYADEGAPAVKSLEGVVRIGADPAFSQLIPRAIGGKLSKQSEQSLRHRPHLPRVYVHVVSPLAVKLLYNRSHPMITAWTMYATGRKRSLDNHPYGYTYFTLDPTGHGAHEVAANFLQEYARDHGAKRLVTDYDGVQPRLEAEIPLVRDPISRRAREVTKLARGIDLWAKREIDGKRRARRRASRRGVVMR